MEQQGSVLVITDDIKAGRTMLAHRILRSPAVVVACWARCPGVSSTISPGARLLLVAQEMSSRHYAGGPRHLLAVGVLERQQGRCQALC